MVLKADQERVKTLLKDTITLLCRNGLSFKAKFCIDAVIGVTLDDSELFYLSMNEVVKSEKALLKEQDPGSSGEENQNETSLKRPADSQNHRRRKNKRPRVKAETQSSSDEENHQDDDEDVSNTDSTNQMLGDKEDGTRDQDRSYMSVKRETEQNSDDGNDIVFIKQELDESWAQSNVHDSSSTNNPSQSSFYPDVPGPSGLDSSMFQGAGDNSQQQDQFGSLSDMNLVPVGSQEGTMMWAQAGSYQGQGRSRGRGSARSSTSMVQGDSSQPGMDPQVERPIKHEPNPGNKHTSPCEKKQFGAAPLSLHINTHHRSRGPHDGTECSNELEQSIVGGSFHERPLGPTAAYITTTPAKKGQTSVTKRTLRKCIWCTYTTLSHSSMTRHRQSKHSGPVECTECGKRFTHQYDLSKHIKLHAAKLMCDKCPAQFKSLSGLTVHNRVVHQQLFNYHCTMCPKKFAMKSHYIAHVNRHMKATPYACHKCRKAFSSKQSCNYHTNHCGTTKTRECEHCKQIFRREANLREHIKYKHGNIRSVCKCGKSFKWPKSLIRHERNCLIAKE